MRDFLLPIVLLGGVIILSLSAYAGWLLAKLYKQKQRHKKLLDEAIVQRNHKIIENVDVIALATLQQQCDLSEAAIRLYMIMDHLQGEKRIEFPQRFPALFELYEVIKDMPRGEERQKIAKRERMKQDLIRADNEARLNSTILKELEEILIFTGAKKAL